MHVATPTYAILPVSFQGQTKDKQQGLLSLPMLYLFPTLVLFLMTECAQVLVNRLED